MDEGGLLSWILCRDQKEIKKIKESTKYITLPTVSHVVVDDGVSSCFRSGLPLWLGASARPLSHPVNTNISGG